MSTTSTNMGLIIPAVGSDPGPNWAIDLDASLNIIDQHDHSVGKGVAISPAGMDINADLPFNSFNATLLRTTRFVSQVSAIANAAPDIGCLYVAGNELYFNDYTGGNQVQITNNGSVNAGAGSISGLPSGTASATYSAGTFTWQSATSTPATMDMGTIIVRRLVASGNGVTIQASGSLATNYSLTLPSAVAASNGSLITSDTSGNLTYTTPDNSTLQITGGNILIKDGGVTRAKQAAVGQQVSSSSGSFTTASTSAVAVTNLNVSITTIGRPVVLSIQPDGTDIPPGSSIGNTRAADATYVQIKRGSTVIGTWTTQPNGSSGWATGVSMTMIDAPAAGTYTYTVYCAVSTALGTGAVTNMVLMAYEL